jgi:hypothetical protein
LGAPNTSSPERSDSAEAPSGSSAPESDAYEKWLVRILLTLALGLAFGVKGMTLIRPFVIDEEEPTEQTSTEQRPTLAEGDVLVPSIDPPVRTHRLQLRATDQAWTFTLIARPDTLSERPYTLTFDRLTTDDGSAFTTAPSHTWAAGDTASFSASWDLPVGRRPDALTVTASVQHSSDSTTSVTRRMDVGHVPVRRQ